MSLDGCRPFGLTPALDGVAFALAQTHGLGGDFDQFVVVDIGECFIQRHLDWRAKRYSIVFAGCANIGQLLGFARVDVEVGSPGVLANNHAGIDDFTGFDEHRAAVFEIPQRECHRRTGFGRNQHAVALA